MHRRLGFTLIELLVVIAIIAILAAILFPVLTEAKKRGQQTQCLGNMKQLWFAFQQYRTDFQDTMPSLSSTIAGAPPDWCGSAWCGQRVYPQTGQLWAYTRNREIYNCPVDKKIPVGAAKMTDFGLSYSVNHWLHMQKFDARIGNKGSRMVFLIHESRKSINDGFFAYGGGAPDVHDNIHYSGTTACYCDGHAKYFSWDDLDRQMKNREWCPPSVKSGL